MKGIMTLQAHWLLHGVIVRLCICIRHTHVPCWVMVAVLLEDQESYQFFSITPSLLSLPPSLSRAGLVSVGLSGPDIIGILVGTFQ